MFFKNIFFLSSFISWLSFGVRITQWEIVGFTKGLNSQTSEVKGGKTSILMKRRKKRVFCSRWLSSGITWRWKWGIETIFKNYHRRTKTLIDVFRHRSLHSLSKAQNQIYALKLFHICWKYQQESCCGDYLGVLDARTINRLDSPFFSWFFFKRQCCMKEYHRHKGGDTEVHSWVCACLFAIFSNGERSQVCPHSVILGILSELSCSPVWTSSLCCVRVCLTNMLTWWFVVPDSVTKTQQDRCHRRNTSLTGLFRSL